MKETEQSTPEIEMKAMQYVNVGYQRILTFECKSGGFNWWEGDDPGNPILSAIAVTMLKDTQQVYGAVDDKVIERTVQYLEKIQQGDGSWGAESHLHAGNENLGAGQLRSTCYIAWSLAEAGYGARESVKRAVKFIQGKVGGEKDLYTMGVCANALALASKDDPVLKGLLKSIRDGGVEEGDRLHWEMKGMTLVNSGGMAGNVEVTALMALALLHAQAYQGDVPAIVNWLAASKDPNGTWGYNTQATVLALKAFLLAAKVEGSETAATVRVALNGRELGVRKFDNFNRDVVWQLEVGAGQLLGENTLELEFAGKGSLGYQVVSSYFVPWGAEEKPKEALSIDLAYDRKKLKVDETVKVTALLRKNDPDVHGMVLVSLGIPPGFDVLAEDLELLKGQKAIANYEVTGRQVIVYLNELPAGEQYVVEYRLKARYPVKAETGESEVRMYYRGEVRSVDRPERIEVE